MANGTQRTAYQNTYRGTQFSADGTTFSTVEDIRIEFALDTAAGRSRTYRKATAKQAATFSVSPV